MLPRASIRARRVKMLLLGADLRGVRFVVEVVELLLEAPGELDVGVRRLGRGLRREARRRGG